ncbi:TetR/AcrR family transcriptional regulator [uncultured Mucilaginibacter sp.]|uniref:TetR/AcrR family transcriptional regulator n=1 Tax=uncultured Mucilaginibacter sp. TaxID=797541 RepID=UPI0025EF6360|nr:TetR/AcrR family transcriptional regulator [uncultured Mucilaginibacter sp.]
MRERIIETSLQQFLEHGIRKMTLQKLVLVLGISTKTMYKYFSNKEALLEDCLGLHYRGADHGISEMLKDSPNPVAAIVSVYSKSMELDFGTNHLFYHDLNYYYPALQDRVMKEQVSGAFKKIILLIQQGINEEYFLAYLKAPIVFETLSAMYTSVTRNSVYKSREQKNELIKHTMMVYLRGICTEKGLQVIRQLKEISI